MSFVDESGSRSAWQRWVPAGAAALLWLAAAAVRVRLLDVPFERDEGGYAYFGRLILAGVPPYVEAYDLRLPGVYAVYAAILAVFPDTPRGVHMALLLANGATAAGTYALARRLLGGVAAVVAVGVFALLSLSEGLQGAFANAEHFLLPLALSSLWWLLRSMERDSVPGIALAGLGLGLALLIKQHAVAFALAGGIWLLRAEWQRSDRRLASAARRGAVFGLAFVVPLVGVAAFYAGIGAFGDLWFWAFEYARAYAAPKPLDEALQLLRASGGYVLGSAPAVWALAVVGAFALGFDRHFRPGAALLGSLLLCSLLAVTPGFVFRQHYFQLLVPVASLLVGLAVVSALRASRSAPAGYRAWARAAVVGVACAALVHAVWVQRPYLFELSPEGVIRRQYPGNPFHESLEVAEFVRARTAPGDRIAILGSEPQIYFYANRRAATGFVYVYPLMEDHPFAAEMRERMIREIEAVSPPMLIVVTVPTSWTGGRQSQQRLRDWFDQYRKAYVLVGLLAMAPGGSRMYAGQELRALAAAPEQGIWIYQRTAEGGSPQ